MKKTSMHKGSWLRRVGIFFVLIWTLVPLYWALNISLQTDAQASSKPSEHQRKFELATAIVPSWRRWPTPPA